MMDEKLEELEGKIVVPGDLVLEKKTNIILGDGLIERNGKIIAVKWGILKVSTIEENHEKTYLISIKSMRSPIIPKRGDLVIGEITNVGNTIAMLRMFFIIKKNKETGRYVIHYLPVPYQGLIHISYVIKPKAKRKLLKKQNKQEKHEYLFNYLAIGDIIFGEIIVDYTVPYGVMIKDVYYGVVAAKCTRCGNPLELKNYKGELTTYCNICRKPDPRKFSVLYDYQLYSTLFKLYKSRKYAYSTEAEW